MRAKDFSNGYEAAIDHSRRLTPFLIALAMAALLMPFGLPGGGAVAAGIAAVPQIIIIEPDVGPVGYEVTITGTAFGADQGSSYVTFGSAKASEYTSWTDTEIVVRVPGGISGNVVVTVTVPGQGTSNQVNFEVVPFGVAFAEGYTGAGFQEYLCIGNPQSVPVPVEVYFLFPDGSVDGGTLTVPARSRTTLNVNEAVGPDTEVSAVVFADREVVVERPMYFNYAGRWSGGHDVLGSPYVSKLWFFAEGYTGAGFEEWICVLNPNDAAANLTFHFQTQGAGEIDRAASVPAGSRASYKVNELLGNDYSCSLVLEADKMVVAERSMYFDYLGKGAHHWDGGHCVMGFPFLAKEYFFAEGTTRPTFEEWLTIQNPDVVPITVNAVYQLGAGQGDPVEKSYQVQAESRYTVYVPDEVGSEKDVSVQLTSDAFFLAERPMYFRYNGYGAEYDGGHCVIGSPLAWPTWFFAEGYTGDGFQEWLCLQNPGESQSIVEVTWLGESGVVAQKSMAIPHASRVTLRANDEAGPGLDLSCSLHVTAGSPIVVERPMYFNFNGWDGGHDVVGYNPYSFGTASLRGGAGEHWMLLCDLPLFLTGAGSR